MSRDPFDLDRPLLLLSWLGARAASSERCAGWWFTFNTLIAMNSPSAQQILAATKIGGLSSPCRIGRGCIIGEVRHGLSVLLVVALVWFSQSWLGYSLIRVTPVRGPG